MSIRRILVIAAVALLGAALAGVGRPEPARSAAEDTTRGLTVTGLGSVEATPDRASFSFGVQTEAATAAAALSANSTAAQRLIAALRSAGIAAADLQTATVSLSPRMSSDGTKVTGYTAQNAVTATIRDLARAGRIVDAAVAAGANQVWGPMLSRSDQTALYRQALRAAVTDARAKAQVLAEAAGGTVGRVLDVQESGAPSGGGVLETAARAAGDVPIEPGTQRIDASVTVTFALG